MRNERTRLDLDGQIAEAKTHEERLGAKYIGWRKGKNRNEFGFAKEGFEDRWISLGDLREGCNPFTKATIGEQEIEAKSYEKELDAKYIGWKKGKSCNYFGFAKEGFEDRWVSLGGLREGKSPFTKPTIGEQEIEAKPYAKKFGATYIGWRRGKKHSEFGFAKEGFEDRWTTLSHLREGNNPFIKLTIGELETEVKTHEERLGAKYIGWKKGKSISANKEFCFSKEGFEDRWITLGNLRAGKSPFTKPTIGEQEIEAKPYAKKFGATYIGWKKIKGNNYFGFAKEGSEDRWITLGNLRKGNNPFDSSGFDVGKVGFLYILLVIIGAEQFIKFGITNNKNKRLKNHTRSLNKIAGQWSQLHIKRFESGQECLDFETKLKRQFWSKRVNLGVNGFMEECFSHSIKDALFSQVL